MDFVILGPTALRDNGRIVPLGATKQRGLLAILLYHVGNPVPVDLIVDHLWGDRSVESHRQGLYAIASRTRAALRTVGLADSLIRVPGLSAYRLDVDPDNIDYHRFRRLLRLAREAAAQDDHRRSVTLLSEATGLCGDEPLADLRGARSEHLRRYLQEAALGAYKFLAESQLKIGQCEAVLSRLEGLTQSHPIDEGLARLWADALHAAGRTDEARAFVLEFQRRYRRQVRSAPTINLVNYQKRGVRGVDRGPTRSDRAESEDYMRSAVLPHQLPKAVFDFVGRDQILKELDAFVVGQQAGANAVVLTGMPGVGKTTLVTYWAQQRSSRFPDGQLYLSAEAHGPIPPMKSEDALARFLTALGVPPDRIPPGGEQRRQRFNELVAGRRMLVVLDNVLNSDHARPLIAGSSTCLTVITSRNRLKGLTIHEGIRSIIVPPLSERDSQTLLTQMIGRQRAEDQAEGMRQLAQASGGLPLALRIIGEHVAARPQAKLLDLVEELRTRILDCEGDGYDEPPLRSVFAWSYNALDANAARLFRLLGLFPGPTIGVRAAAALLGVECLSAERTLNTLARAHLVNHDVAGRYRLHDLLRLYAADRGMQEEPAQERRAGQRRLLDWYLLSVDAAASLLAPERPQVPDLPEADAVAPLAFQTDADAMRWCELERSNLVALVKSASRGGFHRHAWQIPGTIHDIYDRYGRQDDVLQVLRIGLAAAGSDRHQMGRIGMLNNLGATYFGQHDYQRAAHHFEEALRGARQIDFPEAENACSHNLASVHLKAGEATIAIEIFERVLRTCRANGSLPGQASTLHRLGDAHRQLRRYEQAGCCYLEALGIWEQVGFLRGQGGVHGRLAALLLDTGQPQLALTHCEIALEIHDRAVDEASRCDALIAAADARRELGEHVAAVRNATDAIAVSEEIADLQRKARALAVLADILVAVGDAQGAYARCLEGLDVVGDIADPEIHAVLDRLLTIESRVRPTG